MQPRERENTPGKRLSIEAQASHIATDCRNCFPPAFPGLTLGQKVAVDVHSRTEGQREWSGTRRVAARGNRGARSRSQSASCAGTVFRHLAAGFSRGAQTVANDTRRKLRAWQGPFREFRTTSPRHGSAASAAVPLPRAGKLLPIEYMCAEDRAWIMATDYGLVSTYIAAST